MLKLSSPGTTTSSAAAVSAATRTASSFGQYPNGIADPNTSTDPFLTNDFHPLQLASSEILSALRADESSRDADLYRRLTNPSSPPSDAGSNRYHVISGDGCGNVGSSSQHGSSSFLGSGANKSDSYTFTPNAETRGGQVTGENQRQSTPFRGIGTPFGKGGLRGSPSSGVRGGVSSSPMHRSPDKSHAQSAQRPPSQLPTPPTSFLHHERSIPLPSHMADEAKSAVMSSFMGLFADANLVWLTAGEKLFLWSYKADDGVNPASKLGGVFKDNTSWGSAVPKFLDGRDDFCSFTVPSGQSIVTVGIVRPKKGVFKDVVEWCIVLATYDEILLLALARQPSSNVDHPNANNDGFQHGTDSILRLIPTRFSLPTDQVPFLSICGSKDGRIFMGGYDGCLYEMSYEGNVPNYGSYGGYGLKEGTFITSAASMEAAIDEYFDGDGVFHTPILDEVSGSSLSDAVVSSGKRVFSALTFGSLDGSGEGRARKCRKINHSSVSPGSGLMPGALIRVFSSSSEMEARKGGPIVSMVLDEERFCLYTLGSQGVICAYDLGSFPEKDASSSSATKTQDTASLSYPKLACVFDAVASAKLYLDSVSRGSMYPPSTAHALELGNIIFPGGSATAQAGVGGMEGARDILKRHEQESRSELSSSTSLSLHRNMSKRTSNTAGILHPSSIHLVPCSDSKSLTLIAITGGGLRYYLSSLSATTMNSARSTGLEYSIKTGNSSLALKRPSKKITFCHIRAPPPYTSGDGNDGFKFELAPSAVNLLSIGAGGGLPPGIHPTRAGLKVTSTGDVVKSFYGKGIFILALDIDRKSAQQNGNRDMHKERLSAANIEGEGTSSQLSGDTIVAAVPDYASRVVTSSFATNSDLALLTGDQNLSRVSPGGISESVFLPSSGCAGLKSPVLPGGRTFDIVAHAGTQSSVFNLFISSETPTDSELELGPIPSFLPPNIHRKKHAQSNEGSSIDISYDAGRGVISSALTSISNYLRSGQGTGVQVGSVASNTSSIGSPITFRISARHGCDLVGFSDSAGENAYQLVPGARKSAFISRSTASKSARLPSWLLRPSPTTLNYLASQHLMPPGSGSVLVLNAGGLHFFTNSSLLNNFASVLLRASSNVIKDDLVRNFFSSYGYVEGCAMCFALATSSSSSEKLRLKAEKAALCYAHVPSMKVVNSSSIDRHDTINSYEFQPSSLYQGLVKFLSRLLRPFWFKPAVVVTEGCQISSKSVYSAYYEFLPVKVELLLDDVTLDDIRRPLLSLQNLMKKIFVRATKFIPGVPKQNRVDSMDVDDDERFEGSITRAMQNQHRTAQRMNGTSGGQHGSVDELQNTAQSTEERNMHSLYRLVSRCVQLLNLLSCLKRAHSTPSLPEVQWGLLHGLTFHQLITSHEGQQRIESLLNALVSQSETNLITVSSTDSDLLAEKLSKQCYLFFSSASRLAYLGFRSVKDALSLSHCSPQRNMMVNKAVCYLRAAARHWFDPTLVVGRSVPRNGTESWAEVAIGAMDAGSPLAAAANAMMELGSAEGLADVCLVCASNFGGAKVICDDAQDNLEKPVEGMFVWERDLYHRPATNAAGNKTGAGSSGAHTRISGIDVTASDALRTCHGILLYCISKLLGETGAANRQLAEDLVAACASSSDVNFLHLLYEHLLETNQVDILLRIDSSSLENWLQNHKEDAILLSRYYSFHNRNVLAGEVMMNKATGAGEIHLDRRIEYLTRAENYFSAALEAKHLSSNGFSRYSRGIGSVSEDIMREHQLSAENLQERITQIKEQLDVAALQGRLLSVVKQSKNTGIGSEKLSDLTYSLINVSDLFNEYACPLNLFDICLLIFQTCHHNEKDAIKTSWKSIICEEILPCKTNSEAALRFINALKHGSMLEGDSVVLGEDSGMKQKFEDGEWIPRLKLRIIELGKELYGKGADYTFPLDLIAGELEGLRQIHDDSNGNTESAPWPIQIMRDVGVPYYALFECYCSLHTQDGSVIGGVDVATRVRRLSSLIDLLGLWTDDALSNSSNVSLTGLEYSQSTSSQLVRAVKSGGIFQRIDGYKQILEGLVVGNTQEARHLHSKLCDIETKMRNFIF